MDGVIKSDIHYQEHTGELTHRTSQPTENMILDRNAELRKNPGVIQDLGHGSKQGTWGRQIASIPIIMFEKAKRGGFDLSNRNSEIAASEMSRFLNTPEGRACLVR